MGDLIWETRGVHFQSCIPVGGSGYIIRKTFVNKSSKSCILYCFKYSRDIFKHFVMSE